MYKMHNNWIIIEEVYYLVLTQPFLRLAKGSRMSHSYGRISVHILFVKSRISVIVQIYYFVNDDVFSY